MVKLYKSDRGIVHLVLGDYICNHGIGKISEYYPSGLFEGTRDDITCKNCIGRLNY